MLSIKYSVYAIACVALLFVFAPSSAFAGDASERRFIRVGMSEGEVLVKIGKPDTESIDTGGGQRLLSSGGSICPRRATSR